MIWVPKKKKKIKLILMIKSYVNQESIMAWSKFQKIFRDKGNKCS